MDFCIIDDEREVCDILRLLFEARGHRCFVAHNGMDGLELIRKQRPDAVFLDVQMPRMNGMEVLAQLRSDSAIKDVPVMLMTALTRDEKIPAKEWARSTGANAFLPKPFELTELMRVVEELTGIKV